MKQPAHLIPAGDRPLKGVDLGCAVVYIAWAPFGIEPFKRFIQSYVHHNAGADHHLFILCKGFQSESILGDFMAIANMLDCTPILVPSTGFDLGSYEYISRRIDAEYFCFLNSKSVIVADNWLRFLHDHCVGPGIGATGASASFESLYTDHVRSISEGRISRHSLQSVLRRSFANRWRHRIHFPSYPNPHLRTNAFMMNSQVFRRLNFRRIRSRIDTARLENGRISITRQLRQMGLEALVVGKDGAAYRQPDWSRSATFWQLDQGNLLVADNQTEKYSLANPAERTRLSRMAWGADLSKLDVDAAANS